MKLFRNISLCMIAASFIYAAGAYTGNWFYPNHNTQKRYEQNSLPERESNFHTSESNISNSATDSSPQPVTKQSKRLTADTQYIVEEYDMGLDTVTETEEKLPAQYIGMDRDSFIEAMSTYEASPAITDLEKSFFSLEVISFSPERVVVRKSYQTAVLSNQFCLVAENNNVVVYYGDLNTLFMYTDIKLYNLPKELQEEIMHVKYITGEGDLYNFLESYSS